MFGKKIFNKKGQIADIIMFLFFFSFVIYFIVAFVSSKEFFMVQDIVNNIVKSKVEIVRTKGRFTTEEYKDMMVKLGKYGNFTVFLTLDKIDETGRYYSVFHPARILDQTLKVGDIIKIYVESKDRALFAEILSRNFLFGWQKKQSNFRIQSLCAGMVAVDGYIRGGEVIEIINKYINPPYNLTVYVTLIDYTSLLIPKLQDTPKQFSLDNPYDINTPPRTNDWIDPEGRYDLEIKRDDNEKVVGVTITQLLRGEIKEREPETE